MRAVVVREFGGPEVLELSEMPEPATRPSSLKLRTRLAGVNFADVHLREGTYPAPMPCPFIPGNEVLGESEDGRRFVALGKGGGYAEAAAVHRKLAFEVPDAVADRDAIALMLQGNTAWHLLHTDLRLTAEDTLLVPAAAGGVGSLAVQLAKHTGAKVVAMAGTEAKRQLAADLGADAVVDSSTAEGLTERILDAAGGHVTAAMEMTGGDVFHATLDALSPRGRLSVFGSVTGTQGLVPIAQLVGQSKSVTGFWLPSLYPSRTLLNESMAALFAAVADGWLKPLHGPTYKLGQARQAHADLAARLTTGKVVLDLSL
ncbi:zinc-binding dehydrogenase [Kitasatospora sp. NA04385]|uniref:quinone oxidoreductase family protein n=1 Tax=Kitasatospora sp. NA04385 TaxID=2742135 RepID=UPI0015908977|nr:zinc-binding dehydrogenase [Kitasatospora sp. NA04385]QKW20591.1 zinc-binding dehydrogenase [Kitasatospora sp. NA04385]